MAVLYEILENARRVQGVQCAEEDDFRWPKIEKAPPSVKGGSSTAPFPSVFLFPSGTYDNGSEKLFIY